MKQTTQEANYAELLIVNEQLLKALSEANSKITLLTQEVESFKKVIYGSKSEKLPAVNIEHLPLFAREEVAEEEPEKQTITYTRNKGGRKPIPDNIERREVRHDVEDKSCGCCGEEMEVIGEEKSEELVYVPSSLYVNEHIKLKRACRKCKKGVKTAKVPEGTFPIEGARVGVSLLAHLIVSKYADHLPLERQEKMFKRLGVSIPKQRMCDWIGKFTDRYLIPIVEAQRREILECSYIQADETTLKTFTGTGEVSLKTNREKTKLKTGYLWGMLSEKGDVYFKYNISRAGSVANDLFQLEGGGSYRGVVQTDLYAGYNEIYLSEYISRAGCFSHVRRRFIECQKNHPKECGLVLGLIAKLYKVESDAKKVSKKQGIDLIQLREKYRDKRSRVIFDKFKGELEDINLTSLPKTKLAESVSYALKQIDALSLYLDNPVVEIDNNGMERQMRPAALGRKNWLFAGSETGAIRTACLMSLLGSCQHNEVNQVEYLIDVIKRAPSTKAKDILSLTPRYWQAEQTKKSLEKEGCPTAPS